MKKICVVLSVLCLAFFISCETTPVMNVFDDSIPLEECAVLHIGTGLTVKALNGIDVELKRPISGTTGFTFPAGETELLVDLRYNYASDASSRSMTITTYTAEDLIVDYNFEAGQSYNLLFSFVEGKRALVLIPRGSSIPVAYWGMNFGTTLN